MDRRFVTWWQLVLLLDAADRARYHVDMLSLLAQILLEILHEVQRVRLFLAHRNKGMLRSRTLRRRLLPVY